MLVRRVFCGNIDRYNMGGYEVFMIYLNIFLQLLSCRTYLNTL